LHVSLVHPQKIRDSLIFTLLFFKKLPKLAVKSALIGAPSQYWVNTIFSITHFAAKTSRKELKKYLKLEVKSNQNI